MAGERACVGTLAHACRIHMALGTGVPSSEPALGGRRGSQRALLDFPPRGSNKISSEPRATRMGVHGSEAGEAGSCGSKCCLGLLLSSRLSVGLGTVPLHSDLPVFRIRHVAKCDSSFPVIFFRECLQSPSILNSIFQ